MHCDNQLVKTDLGSEETALVWFEWRVFKAESYETEVLVSGTIADACPCGDSNHLEEIRLVLCLTSMFQISCNMESVIFLIDI